MGIVVLPRAWSIVPSVRAKPSRGHSLCPWAGFIVNDGVIVDVVRGRRSTPQTQGAIIPSAVKGLPLLARQYNATGGYDQLDDYESTVPLSNISIVLGQQKTDSTNRASAAFGFESGDTHTGGGEALGTRCQTHCPYSDGTIYWDFGGDSGSNRLSVGSLTFGDDIFVFTSGVNPSVMEIWQNGLKKASQSGGQTRSAVATATTFTLGKMGNVGSDAVNMKFLLVYRRVLSPSEITQLTATPFCWVEAF